MASPAQKADLARLAKIAALLAEAQATLDELAPVTMRQPGMETLRFALGAALERATERHATEHVGITGKLPEGYKGRT